MNIKESIRIRESIRSILKICGSGGLAQFQIVEILPDSAPKAVVSALQKMSEVGEIKDSKSGIARLYHLAKSPKYSDKDYQKGFSLSMC